MSESRTRPPASDRSTKNADVKVDPAYVKTFIQNIFSEDLHAARVLSLSNSVVGVLPLPLHDGKMPRLDDAHQA